MKMRASLYTLKISKMLLRTFFPINSKILKKWKKCFKSKTTETHKNK